MKSVPNRAGGLTVTLVPGDSLSQVPDTHRKLVTPEVAAAFDNPAAYFLELGDRSKLLAFQVLVADLVRVARPSLVLYTAGEMRDADAVGFQWWTGRSETPPHYVILEPGSRGSLHTIPTGLRELYSVVRWVHWRELDGSGGLLRDDQICSLAGSDVPTKSRKFPAKSSFLFGTTGGGDMLIHNKRLESGFVSHETGEIYSLGSLQEAVTWIFEELRAGREPEFDYDRVR